MKSSLTPTQQKAPTVSIVLPTYNQAHYLRFALDGVFQQTYQDFELIVVNDGSTDNTRDVLNEYQQRYNFTVIHQENQKLPRALNSGFRCVRGKYLTWTSSDNIMLPHMLESLVLGLERNPSVGLVYSDWQIINELGTVVRDIHTLDYDPLLLRRVNFINASFLYRRECQEKLGFYNPEYHLAEDWEYWFRISLEYPMLRIPEVLYQYRVHANSLTRKEVMTRKRWKSVGYRKLEVTFRSDVRNWILSKIRWEWTRFKHPKKIHDLFVALLMH